MSVARPINVYLRGTDRRDAGTGSGNINLKKGWDCEIHARRKPLKANSWYYITIRNGNRSSGSVRFEVKAAKDLEGNITSAAKRVTAGTTCYGYHTFPLDEDYFKFVPTETGNYRVQVKNVGRAGYIRSSVQNARGTILQKQDYFGVNKYMSKTMRMTRGTTYYIHVQTGNEEWSDPNTKYRVYIQKR